ncbi:hypothetical protein CBG56_04625 [Fusobacterium polymorphum]|uniref:Riboflavin synthase subunit alpha n=1 Tax=Fusobacterium nucleatum subsp. polymorphum TaxID=76857 RepID=A0A2C6CKF8_FUSNP|nr:hypothetical protein CBG56_04625 [Fusobacterium polymorphum]
MNEVILEAFNELVHLELLTDSEFAANVNFLSLRNLVSNELFFYYILFLNDIASSKCFLSISSFPSKSAIVLAIFKILS